MEVLTSLVNQSRSGDLHAFTQLVRQFQDMAYGCAYAMLKDFHLAEDVAQEAFVDAYRHLDDLRHPRAFPGWFRRIVLKHCDRITRRAGIRTVPLEEMTDMPADQTGPDQAVEYRELQERVLDAIRSLPEGQRMATTLFYINGYSQQEISNFLDVPVTTVKKRLHDAREKLKERMLDMVDETLKSFPLPGDFTDSVVRRAASEADLKRVVELMGGVVESVEEAQKQDMFVVEENGRVESAGHLGETAWSIGSTRLKAARSMAGVSGESAGVPDPAFVKGYRGHFTLAKEQGIRLVLVHGSQYDHAFCGFVPAFYYAVATLPVENATAITTRATVREVRDKTERQTGWQVFLSDPYARKIGNAGPRPSTHIVKQDGAPAGYFHWAGWGFRSLSVKTREAALATLAFAGQAAEQAGETKIHIFESHMTPITQAVLSLGGTYRLRPSCDWVGLDAEMIAILDFAAPTRDLKAEFKTRLKASPAHHLNAALSVEMDGATVGFVAETGRLKIVSQQQKTHRALPRWILTRLYTGYYSGEDILAMGPLPYDRSDGKTPDRPDRDMQPLQLPGPEAELFKALFPKLWPCSMPDPDVGPWVFGEDHPHYQHEEDKTDAIKAEIDALKFPWIGY